MSAKDQFWESEEERARFEESQRPAEKKPEPVKTAPQGGELGNASPQVPAVAQPAAAAPPAPKADVAVDERGVLAAKTLDAQWRVASALAQSGALGDAYNGKPGAILMAMNLAAEKGKNPFSFLHSSYEVKGRITEWGGSALGAVYASGLVKSFQVVYISKEGKLIEEMDFTTPVWGVAAVGERTNPPMRAVRSFSEDDARKANLLGNPKKDVWAQYTRRMLETKAVGALLKILWPDVIEGIPMPEYDEHEKSEPGASSSASTPSGAKERLTRGHQSQAPAAGEVQPMPGVREAAGGSAEPGGSVPRPDLQGDAERSPGEPDTAVPAASRSVRHEEERVPVSAPTRAPRSRGKRVDHQQPPLPGQ